MSAASLSTYLPQTGDDVKTLLARLLLKTIAGGGVVPSQGTALASAARTGTTRSSDISNALGHTRVVFHLNITAMSGTTLIFRFLTKDPLTGIYTTNYDLASNIAVGGSSSKTTFCIGPGIGYPSGATGSLMSINTYMANMPVPSIFAAEVVPNNGNSHTYSLSYELLP